MSADSRSTFTALDWITDRVLRGLIFGFLKLPYETRVPLMGRVMERVVGPLTGYRKRAEENLLRIYPDMTAVQRREIANACCNNFGRNVIENYAPTTLAEYVARTPPTGAGIAAIKAARAANRPVLFVTGHFANFEAPRHALDALGYPTALLYRPMRNGYFNAHYARTMARWGGPAFAQGRPGTKDFIQHISKGGMGTLLFDVSAPGKRSPFMGHAARTSLSTAQIALENNALVIPYFATRQPDGLTFAIEFQDPIPHGEAEDMVMAMTKRLEDHIAKHPSQWFWIHRRWKG